MARMRFTREVPPRGWFYVQKETKLRIEGESIDDLAKKVIDHRVYKGLPRQTIEEAKLDIERQICTRLTARECVAEPGLDDQWVPFEDNPTISIKTVISASKAALEFIASGAKLVDESERARRAEICKGCAANNRITGCRCSPFYKLIEKMIPAERRDPELFVCSVCACSIMAKVNMPENVIIESNKGRNFNFPAYCWQKDLV